MFKSKLFRKDKGLTQYQLGEILGCGQTNISMIEKIGKDLEPAQYDRLVSIYGKEVDRYINNGSETDQRQSSNSLRHKEDTEGKVLLIPFEAMAGSLIGFSEGVNQWDCRHIPTPFPGAEYAIQISGDSMLPDLKSGDVIYIRQINDRAFIPWGHTVVMTTVNGALVKKIFPCDKDPDYIIAKSTNPEYPPYKVEAASIFGIYKILGTITPNTTL